ncbi:hypothetical protein BH09BAC5_BH09BAC5_09570 [soil metagenome]
MLPKTAGDFSSNIFLLYQRMSEGKTSSDAEQLHLG